MGEACTMSCAAPVRSGLVNQLSMQAHALARTCCTRGFAHDELRHVLGVQAMPAAGIRLV